MMPHQDHDHIAIIGAGYVGSMAARALIFRVLLLKIVLYDR